MSHEITGTLIRILPEETGESAKGTWVKQTFAIETHDQYPRTVAFMLWGDKRDMLKPYKQGDQIKVSFDAESREWQNKFFTDLKPWRIEPAGTQQPGAAPMQQAATAAHATVSADSLSIDDNDLPF